MMNVFIFLLFRVIGTNINALHVNKSTKRVITFRSNINQWNQRNTKNLYASQIIPKKVNEETKKTKSNSKVRRRNGNNLRWDGKEEKDGTLAANKSNNMNASTSSLRSTESFFQYVLIPKRRLLNGRKGRREKGKRKGKLQQLLCLNVWQGRTSIN